MSRLEIRTPSQAQLVMDEMYKDMSYRLAASPPGLCPVDMVTSFVSLCHSQSCGKCVPCRVGLGALSDLLKKVMDGKATMRTLELVKETASVIADSADCAIGTGAGAIVLNSLRYFYDDYVAHVEHGHCFSHAEGPVPCVSYCPAHVDIPGYLALVNEGRYQDAVRLIRKDNPFPVACAYICEHPCESRCRRQMIDEPLNIRGLKRYAVDNAGVVPAPKCAEPTGKTVAVIGSGPAGMTAAYYLSLMGHKVTIFERRKKLGGMLRYGIPAYRFPRELLERDINCILSTGVEVKTECDVGKDIALEDIVNGYDSVFISVGAHTDSKAHVDGEDLNGVMSAVELLRGIGDEEYPDFSGKTVAVIGGGNVAMDVTRTSLRLGAKKVYCVYRRRQQDMTALPEEVEGAIAEGAELLTLKAPARIEGDSEGNAIALWVKPQLPGSTMGGRPKPVDADAEEERIEADIIIVATGQRVESAIFEKFGIPTKRGILQAMATGQIFSEGKLFAGGDCATGPATGVRAVAAGKTAAANIDEFLGFHHEISVDVKIPTPHFRSVPPRGRVNTTERKAFERMKDFECIECGMSPMGAAAESSRCLRCDHYGYGAFRGGRVDKW